MTIRKSAIIAGILIITAYLMLGAEATTSKPLVLFLDIVSGGSVIALAILMFPLFKQYGKLTSVGYLVFKVIEGLLMIAAGYFYLNETTQQLRTQIYADIQPLAFIAGGFLFYYLLYVSKLVPRFISIWGGIAIFCLLLVNLLTLLGVDTSTLQFLLILIITNELFLSIWLIAKGFSKTSKN